MLTQLTKLNNRIQKSSDKKKIIKDLEKMWHIAVFMREGNRCIVCGKPATDAHHIIRRSQSLALKYDLKNGVPLCRACHFGLHKRDDIRIYKAILEYIGDERFLYLMHHKRDIFKNSKSHLKEVANQLLKKLEAR